MKRGTLILVFCLIITGCSVKKITSRLINGTSCQIIEVTERMFVTQITEICMNSADYIGKIIQFEGIYDEYELEGMDYQRVYRRTNGCCGDDGIAGFDVIWDGVGICSGDWVSVSGVLEEYIDDFGYYLRINPAQLHKLEMRGQEFVVN